MHACWRRELSGGELSGTVPAGWGAPSAFPALRYLTLDDNALTGGPGASAAWCALCACGTPAALWLPSEMQSAVATLQPSAATPPSSMPIQGPCPAAGASRAPPRPSGWTSAATGSTAPCRLSGAPKTCFPNWSTCESECPKRVIPTGVPVSRNARNVVSQLEYL